MSKQSSEFKQGFPKMPVHIKHQALTQRTHYKSFKIKPSIQQCQQLPITSGTYGLKTQINPYCSRCQQMKSIYVCLNCSSKSFCWDCFTSVHSIGKFILHSFVEVHPEKGKQSEKNKKVHQRNSSFNQISLVNKLQSNAKLLKTNLCNPQQLATKRQKQQIQHMIIKLNYIIEYQNYKKQHFKNQLLFKWNKILEQVKMSYNNVKNTLQNQFYNLLQYIESKKIQQIHQICFQFFNKNQIELIKNAIQKYQCDDSKYEIQFDEQLLTKITKFCSIKQKQPPPKQSKLDYTLCTELIEQLKGSIQKMDIKSMLHKNEAQKQSQKSAINENQNIIQVLDIKKFMRNNKKTIKNKLSCNPLSTSRKSNKQIFNQSGFSGIDGKTAIKKIKSQNILSVNHQHKQIFKIQKKNTRGVGITQKII